RLAARRVACSSDVSDRRGGPPGCVAISRLHPRPVALDGERRGDPRVWTEVHGEPAIEGRRLPVTRTPGAITQPEPVDRPAPIARHDVARGAAVLLAMPARER